MGSVGDPMSTSAPVGGRIRVMPLAADLSNHSILWWLRTHNGSSIYDMKLCEDVVGFGIVGDKHEVRS